MEGMMQRSDDFIEFLKARHKIWVARADGKRWPWTQDPILQNYKFTNVYRELDRVTLWMREHLTRPYEHKPGSLMLFNCGVFRMFGHPDFYTKGGMRWVNQWDPDKVKRLARAALERGEQVFTGAYIIPNMGIPLPKEEVVCDRILTPLWNARKDIAQVAADTQSLEATWQELNKLPGFGGKGFMAYEVITDLRWTPVLADAVDVDTWANAGPGARRGIWRIMGEERYEKPMPDPFAVQAMRVLLKHARKKWPKGWPPLEMREIEHSLCEFDKYERVRLGQGKPRSKYQPKLEDMNINGHR